MPEVMLINLPYPQKFVSVDAMEEYRGGHLGIGYLASVVEQTGVQVEVVDCPRFGIDLDQLMRMVHDIKPVIIGITFYHINVMNLYRFLGRLPELAMKPLIVLGGYQATATAATLLQSNRHIDCVVLSEGERSFRSIVNAYIAGEDWRSINGIAYLDQAGQVQFNPPQSLVANLDELPFPKRTLQPGQKRAGITVTRGCYGRCTFCASELFYSYSCGKVLRTRSPENTVDELEYLYNAGIRFVQIHSDNFLMADRLSKQWMDSFCRLIRERQIQIKYQIFARCDQIEADLIRRLMDVGLHCIFLGVESGIQERLVHFRKNLNVEVSRKAIGILYDLGVKLKIGFIPFDPDTRAEDLLQEIGFLKDVEYEKTGTYLAEPFSIRFPLAVFPGTHIHNQLEEAGRLTQGRYGYDFVDSRMEEYTDKITPWQNRLKPFSEHTSYYYLAEELGEAHLFSQLDEAIGQIIKFDLEVNERLIQDIIHKGAEASISRSDEEELDRYIHQFIDLCRTLKPEEVVLE